MYVYPPLFWRGKWGEGKIIIIFNNYSWHFLLPQVPSQTSRNLWRSACLVQPGGVEAACRAGETAHHAVLPCVGGMGHISSWVPDPSPKYIFGACQESKSWDCICVQGGRGGGVIGDVRVVLCFLYSFIRTSVIYIYCCPSNLWKVDACNQLIAIDITTWYLINMYQSVMTCRNLKVKWKKKCSSVWWTMLPWIQMMWMAFL